MENDKRERLAAYVEAEDVESVWFARPNAFAWLTGGSNVVDREGDVGVAAAGYDGTDLRVLTNAVEADRLADEELPADATLETYPWYEASIPEALAARVDGPAAADVDVPASGFERVDPTPLRQPLTDDDIERYRALGRETATAVESVCRELRPDDTEREVASALAVALSARGIETPVVLVGGGERARRYRHYTPTEGTLGEYALVSVTAERDGLHASCTRTVAFDPPSWLEDRHTTAARVETTALAATRAAARAAASAGDVFVAIRDAYDALGHGGEWERHHQGGAAGFAGREWIATPGHEAAATAPMAYAWNPTVEGAKSEDTVLVTDDGFETLTATGTWPTREVRAVEAAVPRVDGDGEIDRPPVLERPDVLYRDDG